jgi:3-mercaptopyruvate sulfurtransferase SseA
VALKQKGVDNVWVLDGGFKAWREQGFSVSKSLGVLEVVAERLGVKLPRR